MMRPAATQSVFAILALLLFGLQMFGSPVASASAHTGHASVLVAADGPGHADGADQEFATCATHEHDAEPNGLPRTRDRHRTPADPASQTTQRCLVARDACSGLLTAVLTGPVDVYRATRSSTVLSPAVLQVFRC
ncbi:hypothetical protein [Streptomyces himalayensis]|uniref:Secreted protein n=1 Tax=Streptomyces himalayensis subsp. himalayensis TaxID=2756131 RepID=A0A7W0DVD8_9ACTN|nr:hypothetical protein [Streptomyces himalayensis]MBA2951937.1 hypothetical protein [Streptomyces himalayensis subsp. himalayensis]